MKPRLLILLACVALVLGGTALAHAGLRPGGGHSFSGGSHYSGGGSHYSGGGGGYSGGGGSSGGSSGDLIMLFELFFRFPQIGIPVLLAIVFFVYARRRAATMQDASTWDSGLFRAAPVPAPAKVAPERKLATFRDDDPDFSAVLFDDFVFSLYARAQRARHDAQALAQLAPYLSEAARGQLARLGANGTPLTAVVVGSASIVRVRRQDDGSWARVAFEANLIAGAAEYVREEWVFHRAAGARTRPWKGARTFDCPNCAAPATRYADNKCEFCGEVVDAGRFDWAVHSIERTLSEARPPSLTGTVDEVGTNDPTVYDAAAQSEWAALLADDPAISAESFGARLALVYAALNRGWNASDARLVRPWVSDGLLAYLEYWLDAYRAQHLRNVLEAATLANWTIARVTRDLHYDAVTVRLWASGLDYTTEVSSGRVVGGSDRQPRAYSEYWTLIRAAGVRGAPRADRACPNCGAELVPGMGGACTHCGAVVTRGDFDWVLSKIEQDESYSG